MNIVTTEGFRPKLQRRNGKRARVFGEIQAFGKPTRETPDGKSFRPVAMRDIRDVATNELLVDHAWLPIPSDEPAWSGFRIGEIVSFDGTIGTYLKGRDDDPTKRVDCPIPGTQTLAFRRRTR